MATFDGHSASAAHPRRDSGEFASQVSGMFDRIAAVYDLMNRTMTAGLDREWRERTAERAELTPGDSALDVCCGTGDLSFELAREVGPTGSVIGCDFSERMLDRAREKRLDGAYENVRFEWADALELPYSDGRFDAVTVGFGVRNLADLDGGLRQMARVLKPGGRIVILEITQPQRPPLSVFFRFWFDTAVPLLGHLAGDADAYSYLPESVRSFPAPDELAARLDRAGFERIRYTVLAGGIITIHSGVRRGSG